MRISDWSSDVCSTVRERGRGKMFKHILLPIDLSEAASQDKAVDVAVELARSFGSRLHVMTIVPHFGAGFVSSFFPTDYQDQAVPAAQGTGRALGWDRGYQYV